jgi:hypothetical protein
VTFTTATITHQFQNADSTAASGTITFRLSGRMSQAGITIGPAEVTATLDGTGNLSKSLTSNVDAATVPQSTQWITTLRILGWELEEYAIVVPSGGGTVDLFTLLPNSPTTG